jgi:hypothetical protein
VLVRGVGVEATAAADRRAAAGGADAERLATIMGELTAMAHDAQQRSWSDYDDAPVIREYLAEFVALTRAANPAVVVAAVRDFRTVGRLGGHHEVVDTLAVYFQMETRPALRVLVLRLLLALVALDPTVVVVLQESVLPVELVHSLVAAGAGGARPAGLAASLRLLACVWSCGRPLPAALAQVVTEPLAAALLALVAAEVRFGWAAAFST